MVTSHNNGQVQEHDCVANHDVCVLMMLARDAEATNFGVHSLRHAYVTNAGTACMQVIE